MKALHWTRMIVAAGLLAALPGVVTGATLTIDGVSTNAGTDFYIDSVYSGYSTLIITNAGSVIDSHGLVGLTQPNTMAVVTGPGSVWTNTVWLEIAGSSSGNQLTITNQGRVISPVAYLAYQNNGGAKVLVTGSGSIWNSGDIQTSQSGNSSTSSQIDINKGGAIVSDHVTAYAVTNIWTVTDPGSVWSNTWIQFISPAGGVNTLVISNQAHVVSGGTYLGYANAGGYSSSLVTGTGSVWNAGTLFSGYGNRGHLMTVAKGGTLITTNAIVGYGFSGFTSGYGTNLVSDSGSTWINDGNLRLGVFNTAISVGNQIIVTNQAQLIVLNGGTVIVGASSGSTGNGVRVASGGLMEANTLVTGSGAGNTISNSGGIYQFTTSTPTITPGVAGTVVIDGGTISYRGITDAPLTPVANINYSGDNAYRLNNATNATGLASYTFDSVAHTANPSNYQSLALINNAGWRSDTLAIGSGGSLLASNTTSSIDAVVSGTGLISVVNSKLTFVSNVVIAGSYVSDPSTNTFLNDLTVTPTGTLAGGPGDLYDFKKNLFINSTNNLGFNLASSTVSFSGGGDHTNAVTGGDFGTNGIFTTGNFGYGKFSLGSNADQVYFVGGGFTNGDASANALYIHDLDLLNDTNLVANLHSSFNIYYLSLQHDTFNTYLNDQKYLLDGGGWLMPVVPEPSSLLLAGLSLAGGLWMRKRRST